MCGAHVSVSDCGVLCWSFVCVVDEKVKVVASPKIPLAKDAAKHKAGGGNVEICTRHTNQHTSSVILTRLLSLSPDVHSQ